MVACLIDRVLFSLSLPFIVLAISVTSQSEDLCCPGLGHFHVYIFDIFPPFTFSLFCLLGPSISRMLGLLTWSSNLFFYPLFLLFSFLGDILNLTLQFFYLMLLFLTLHFQDLSCSHHSFSIAIVAEISYFDPMSHPVIKSSLLEFRLASSQ